MPKLVMFVHGWSVTDTDTYGDLPARLRQDAGEAGMDLDVEHLYLGQYVSFRDEIRVEDIASAFDRALTTLLAKIGSGRRAVCITHSTGGPVVREWLDRYSLRSGKPCPISHLIMLAPANFGSALAQLGKTRIGHLKAWFNGVEPGQRVLDWLELGSPEANQLNLRWIDDYPKLDLVNRRPPVYLFVLSGDAIDRKLYDSVNPYTGENGSDGVVRLAAANLNAGHVILRQPEISSGAEPPTGTRELDSLEVASSSRAASTAFKIVPDVSHSGERMGIMRSVKTTGDHPVLNPIADCLRVTDAAGYRDLTERFARENAEHQKEKHRLEVEHVPVLLDRHHIHDPMAMVIFRFSDDQGAAVTEVDLLLTAGPRHNPDELPTGFLVDRQANSRRPECLTFHINHAALAGCRAIFGKKRKLVRARLIPRNPYGLLIQPRKREQFVEYWPTSLSSSSENLMQFIHPARGPPRSQPVGAKTLAPAAIGPAWCRRSETRARSQNK